MKKAFKVLLAILACAVLMCPLFAGCANPDAEYIESSASCRVEYEYEGAYYPTVMYSFLIDVKGVGDYEVHFNLNIYSSVDGKLINTDTHRESFRAKEMKQYEIKGGVHYFDVKAGDYFARIANVQITRKMYDVNSQGYAIGFGVTAAVLTCAITAYFVITKLSEKKEK